MFEISKGDGIFDLAEALVELFARTIGRILGKTTPDRFPSQWGWTDWLWLAIVVCIVVVLVRRHRRKKLEAAASVATDAVRD